MVCFVRTELYTMGSMVKEESKNFNQRWRYEKMVILIMLDFAEKSWFGTI